MNHKEQAHQFMLPFLESKPSHVLDMTCGNGHDTLFLAQHAKKVTAIDIQEQAILSTKKRCIDYTNINYIHGNHSNIDYKKMTPIHGAIYNLGYLPHSDKSIITTSHSTVQSLEAITPLLRDFIVIAAYRGHPGGNEEYEAVKDFLDTHYPNYTSIRYETPLSPVTFLVDLSKPSQ